MSLQHLNTDEREEQHEKSRNYDPTLETTKLLYLTNGIESKQSFSNKHTGECT